MDIATYGQNPGMSAIVVTNEANIWVGRESHLELNMMPLSSATLDAGNTPTSSLRPGLLLGKITATNLLKEHAPAGVDGSETAVAVLQVGQSTLDSSGAVMHKNAHVLLKGILNASNLLLLTALTRRQLLMSHRFLFDDDLEGKYAAGGQWVREIPATGAVTVTTAHVGALLVTTAAATFTLPTLAAGLGPFEFLNAVDADMAVVSAAGNDIIYDGDLAASSLTFSTAAHKIGGRLQVCANAAGTKWLVRNFSGAPCVVTIV